MIEKESLLDTLQKISGSRVLCVGDGMLDRYIYGTIDRISPEAPIPVLKVEREKHMLGGAGNVVANLAALGVHATLISAVAADPAGDDIRRLLNELGIESALESVSGRPTTVKSRFIGATQQMLRVDREDAQPISADLEKRIIALVETHASKVGAIILSDYGKGLLTDNVIKAVIAAAQKAQTPVIVDPKGRDFSRYRGADIITPNRKELEEATGLRAVTDEEVIIAAEKMLDRSGVKNALITRSKDGMTLVMPKHPPANIPTRVREVFDVSGAGDTVIAGFAGALAAGADMQIAATLANIAAGIVVGKSGTATVRPDEIRAAISDAGQAHSKVMSASLAAEQAERAHVRGLKVGFTNGCFDLLHPGHVSTLRQSKAQCDVLIVAINSDASVRKIKGPLRPVQNESARADILAALDMVDMVVIFDEDTPLSLIKEIRPDVLVKGGQYTLEEVVGYDVVASYGGKVVRAEMEEGFSTTNTIARMSGSG